MQKVAVIGAGAAGLCVGRHLSVCKNITFDIFEKSDSIGGVWNYTEDTGFDKYGLPVHSAMYSNLRTNLPKQTIEFPDFPFKEDTATFIYHYEVHEYLKSYAKKFDFVSNIKFETNVTKIVPSDKKWIVEYNELKGNTSVSKTYDSIFVCNGHYAKPDYPSIPNQSLFKGHIIHSHSYRHNSIYADKRVVLLGGRSSGTDIALDVALVASHVRLSHRTSRLPDPLPTNFSQSDCISRYNEDGETIEFMDGSKMKADAVIYCTGYHYDFPFLSDKCDVTVNQKRITWLYNHIINAKHPTMAFIGICARNAPLPQFHCQAQYAISVIFGDNKLPTSEEMMQEIEIDYQNRLNKGMQHREAHVMEDLQWPYNNYLADLAKVDRVPLHVQELYWLSRDRRKTFVCTYKQETYKKIKGKYQLVEN